MAAVAPALLVLDGHDIGTVGHWQLHPHSVLPQLRAGRQLELDGRIVRKPHGVLLIVDQTQGMEDVTGALGIRASDDGGGVVSGRIIALNDIGRVGSRRQDVVHLARRDVGTLVVCGKQINDYLAQPGRA